MKFISRAVRERNISTLHRAGDDFVLSDGWMGSTAIFNCLNRTDVFLVSEGIHAREIEAPPLLVGKTLAEAAVPRETGCDVVALRTPLGLRVNPAADEAMQSGHRIILICTPEAEHRFLERYGAGLSPVCRQ